MTERKKPFIFPNHLAWINKLILRVEELVVSRKGEGNHSPRWLREGDLYVKFWKERRWIKDESRKHKKQGGYYHHYTRIQVKLGEETVYWGDGFKHRDTDLELIPQVLDMIDRMMVLDDMGQIL